MVIYWTSALIITGTVILLLQPATATPPDQTVTRPPLPGIQAKRSADMKNEMNKF